MKKIFYLSFLCLVLLGSCVDQESQKKISDLNGQVSMLLEENKKLRDELMSIKTLQDKKDIQVEGRWRDVRPMAGTVMTLEKNLTNNKYYLKQVFEDGSQSYHEVRMSKYEGLIRFDIIGWESPEFFVIEKNGDLAMYSQNRKFATALSF